MELTTAEAHFVALLAADLKALGLSEAVLGDDEEFLAAVVTAHEHRAAFAREIAAGETERAWAARRVLSAAIWRDVHVASIERAAERFLRVASASARNDRVLAIRYASH